MLQRQSYKPTTTTRMKNLLICSALLIGMTFMASCKKDQDDPADDPTGGGVSLCDTVSPSFATDVMPIIERSCSDANLGSCHAAGSPRGDYTIFTGIKVDADNGSIENRVLNTKSMPPSFSNGPTTLAVSELNTIQCWLENGALDN